MIAQRQRRKYQLTDPQYRLLVELCDAKVVAFIGGVGCSKTKSLALGVVQDAVIPNNYVGIAAGTYPQLRRSTIREVRATLADIGMDHTYNKGDNELHFRNGTVAPFMSCDVDPVYLRGPEFGALHIDETEAVGEEQANKLMERVRKPGPFRRRTRLYGNPGGREHWTTRRFYTAPQPGYHLVSASTYDNPFLPADAIAALELIYPPGTVEHRRNVLGELNVPVEGAVYPEFGDHCLIDADDVDDFVREHGGGAGYAGGLDFGARHAFVFEHYLLCNDDTMIFVAEHYARGALFVDHAASIQQIYRGGPIFADHDAQGRIELEAYGVTTDPAPKHIGVLDGIHAVRRRIRDGRFKVVAGACPNLCREMSTYKWAKGLREVPEKKDDDAVDALRYAITGLDYAMAEDDSDVLAQMFQSFA